MFSSYNGTSTTPTSNSSPNRNSSNSGPLEISQPKFVGGTNPGFSPSHPPSTTTSNTTPNNNNNHAAVPLTPSTRETSKGPLVGNIPNNNNYKINTPPQNENKTKSSKLSRALSPSPQRRNHFNDQSPSSPSSSSSSPATTPTNTKSRDYNLIRRAISPPPMRIRRGKSPTPSLRR